MKNRDRTQGKCTAIINKSHERNHTTQELRESLRRYSTELLYGTAGNETAAVAAADDDEDETDADTAASGAPGNGAAGAAAATVVGRGTGNGRFPCKWRIVSFAMRSVSSQMSFATTTQQALC